MTVSGYLFQNFGLLDNEDVSTNLDLGLINRKCNYKEKDKLKKDVYDLHRQLTFKIPRVDKEQDYYVIFNDFSVKANTELNDDYDDMYYNVYNYFTSKEDAEKYGAKLQAYLIELRKEEYIKGE